MNPQLQLFLKSAIPLVYVSLQSSMDNADRVPESHYSELSEQPNRRAELYLTPNYLFCRQKSKTTGKWVTFGTSAANVKDFRVKEETPPIKDDPKPKVS